MSVRAAGRLARTLPKSSVRGACGCAVALALACGARPAFAQTRSVEVEAALERSSVRLGETVGLYVRVRAAGVAAPQVEDPQIAGLAIVRSEDRSAFRFQIPGGAVREFHREYVLRADRPGDLLIPPITVRVGGVTYETKPLRLRVLADAGGIALAPGLAPDLSEEVAVRVTVDPETVFVGQQATVTTVVFVDASVRGQLRREPEVRTPNLQGVWATDLPVPQGPELRTVGGREVWVQAFRRAVFPLDSGVLLVPPAAVGYEVRRGFLYAPQSFEARSAATRLVVRPLPAEGRPPGFTGAVGRYSVDAWVDRPTVRVGAAVNLTLEVRGRGHLGGLVRPGLPPLEAFRTYEAGESADLEARDDRWGGRKRFHWLLVPERVGRAVIPAIELPYFDPEEATYRIASSAPLVLDVQPAAALSAADGERGLALRHVKTSPARARGLRIWDRPGFWALQAIPPLALALALWRARRSAGPRAPGRRVLRRARLQGLARLRTLAAEPHADFFGALRRFVVAWLEQRLGRGGLGAAGSLEMQEALEDAGCSPGTAREVAEFLESCARQRFAPVPPPPDAREDALGAAGDLLARVDREVAPRRRSRRRALLLYALPALALQEDAFRAGVRAYEQGDYAEAARAFAEHVHRSGDEPHGLYNLANTYYLTGDRGRAIYLWLRAAAHDPRDADIRTNLRLASGDDPVLDSALPPVPATPDELALLFAALWWAAGAAGIAAVLRRGTAARWAAPGLAAAAVAVASLLGRATLRDPVAVTLVEDAVLRAGPALQSEPLLRLPAGVGLWVDERRELWVRVRRPGVGTGWIPREEVGIF